SGGLLSPTATEWRATLTVPPVALALPRRALPGSRQGQGGVDQPDGGESLGEVADLPLEMGIVLLCQQTDVVAQPQESLEQLLRLVAPAHQRVVVGEPEGAGEEGALARRQTV